MRTEVIGNATLYLADAAEALQEIGKAAALVTDPPYGVGMEYGRFIDTEENVRDTVVPTISKALALTDRAAITPGTRCAWFYPRPDELGQVYFPAGAGFSRWGFTCSQPILYYGKDPHPPTNKKPNSYVCTEMAEKNGHPCPKPEKWMEWLVWRASMPGETIIDPFMGSGTTGVVCANLGRPFIGVELEPEYFEIACIRIAAAQSQQRLFE